MELNPEAPILIIGERASISADQGEVPGWARFSGIIWTDIRKRLPPELMEEHIYIISGYNGLTKSSTLFPREFEKLEQKQMIRLFASVNGELQTLVENTQNPIKIALAGKYLPIIDDDFHNHPRITVCQNQFYKLSELIKDTVEEILGFYPSFNRGVPTFSAPAIREKGPSGTAVVSNEHKLPISEQFFGGYQIYNLPKGTNAEAFAALVLEHTDLELEVGLPPILEGLLEEPNHVTLHRKVEWGE